VGITEAKKMYLGLRDSVIVSTVVLMSISLLVVLGFITSDTSASALILFGIGILAILGFIGMSR
jgi:hypothetical protein